MSGQIGQYDVLRCCNCGYLSVHPLPEKDEIERVYTNEYFVKSAENQERTCKGYENCLAEKFSAENRRMAISRLDIIEMLLSEQGISGKTILDVGCSSGDFLLEAICRGWSGVGVEINSSMRGLVQTKCHEAAVYEKTDEVHERFNAVTLWEYLEHLLDPIKELQLIYQLLLPGGVLCISFPNMECRSSLRSKIDWLQFKPPEHLHYWDARSISSLLAKHQFRVLGYRYHGHFISIAGSRCLGSRGNRKTVFWPLMSAVNYLMRPYSATRYKSFFLSLTRRSFEGIEVYARKEK